MLTAKEIRESFKKYFEEHDHHIVPSAPMVIKDDPTLMFTNAGMNQFKDIILGNKEPQWRRVADSQKCLRVSGKHNDLEEVGHDTYHHTMFEMLGNWSFGDYFKKEAIDYCWEYLVDVLKLDPSMMYATVFEGSPSEGLERDNEAASYWEKHLPKDHIINGNRHDNFWEMGDTGPCGPCSELHIDLRSDEEKGAVPGAELVNKDNPQVIEIWNLVFMQYNRKADGSLEPLPAKVIDTGMGFERLCMALQGKKSNYDTDVFQPLIKKIGLLAGKEYGKDHDIDVAMRVIADHVRTIAFSIADGQLPSNAKAGYVIRRILRRAVRYGYTFLGFKESFMHLLVDTLIESMGEAYPELPAQTDLIKHVIKEEEDAFLRTLETGMKMIEGVIAKAKSDNQTEIDGAVAFTLYDTYGFPLDLTELILKENNMTVNKEQFDTEMAKQKQRARNAAAVEASDWVELQEGVTEFVGYDLTECETKILRYRHVVQKKNEYFQVVLATTPFYAEMGGQVGDKGWLINGDEKIDESDRVVLGSIQPDFTYGFGTQLQVYDFDFSLTFAGSHGSKVYNALARRLEQTGDAYNVLTTVLDSWTPENGNNVLPRTTYTRLTSYIDDRYVQSASYLKLRNLTIGYRPRLPKAVPFGVRVYATASNLFTISPYKGYDPEVSSGTDSGAYPSARTFTFGVNLTL